MTICGGQRDAPRNIIPRTDFRRDAGPSTALAGYAAGRYCRERLTILADQLQAGPSLLAGDQAALPYASARYHCPFMQASHQSWVVRVEFASERIDIAKRVVPRIAPHATRRSIRRSAITAKFLSRRFQLAHREVHGQHVVRRSDGGLGAEAKRRPDGHHELFDGQGL